VECVLATDCPEPSSECIGRTCGGGQCGEWRRLARTPCSGGVCDGTGECVECLNAADCRVGPCATASCQDQRCVTTPRAASTACGGGVCDGDGACVECLTAYDCQTPSDCYTASCDTNACNQEQRSAGAACEGGDGSCDAAGTCTCQATGLRPRVLVLLDTSSWMARTAGGEATFGDGVGRPATGGDNSNLVSDGVFYGCGTSAGLDRDCDGWPNDSKLAIAKRALHAFIATNPGIDFALARFAQAQGAGLDCEAFEGFADCTANPRGNPQCNSGNVVALGSCVSDIPDACEPGIGANPAARSATTSTDFDGCINYSSPYGCTDQGGDVLVGFPDLGPFQGTDSRAAIFKWIDNIETNFTNTTTLGNFCNHAATGDCELRATGGAQHGAALRDVLTYLAPLVGQNGTNPCRTYAVILVTGSPHASICANAADQAAVLHSLGIRTYVIDTSSLAMDWNAPIALAGGTSNHQRAVTAAQITAALTAIVASL
jgi:hypothetical protein